MVDGLAAYERRHGWKGKLENMLASDATLELLQASRLGRAVAIPATTCMRWSRDALPLEIDARIGARSAGPEIILLPSDWKWTGVRYGDALVKPGDIIYVHLTAAT